VAIVVVMAISGLADLAREDLALSEAVFLARARYARAS